MERLRLYFTENMEFLSTSQHLIDRNIFLLKLGDISTAEKKINLCLVYFLAALTKLPAPKPFKHPVLTIIQLIS